MGLTLIVPRESGVVLCLDDRFRDGPPIGSTGHVLSEGSHELPEGLPRLGQRPGRPPAQMHEPRTERQVVQQRGRFHLGTDVNRLRISELFC